MEQLTVTEGQADTAKMKHQWNYTGFFFFFHTCTINYFEGDSYELTMESKSIIVFHYYANYAKKSSKIKSY